MGSHSLTQLSVRITMYSIALSLLIIASAQASKVEQPKDLLCDICVDIVTDIDEWITSDTTMDEIINFVEGLCSLLSFDPYLSRSVTPSSRTTSPRSSMAWSMTTLTPLR